MLLKTKNAAPRYLRALFVTAAYSIPRVGNCPLIIYYTAPVLDPSTSALRSLSFINLCKSTSEAKLWARLLRRQSATEYSWAGERSPVSFMDESEPRRSVTGFAETLAPTYLTQWVMIGSTPHLVMYN